MANNVLGDIAQMVLGGPSAALKERPILTEQGPGSIGELLLGRSLEKPSAGKRALGTLLGTLALSGLGAGLGALSGGRRGAGQGAMLGGGLGIMTDIGMRQAMAQAPALEQERLEKAKLAELQYRPTSIKEFEEYQLLSPEQKKMFTQLQEAKRPVSELAMAGLGLRKEAAERAGVESESAFRKEFMNNPTVKDYQLAKVGFDKTQTLATKKDPSGFDDYALIVNFVKVLDPGSVAREGEVAAAERNASYFQRIGIALAKGIHGTKLLPAQRAALLNSSKDLYGAHQNAFGAYGNEMKGIAESYGFKSERVLPGYKQAVTESPKLSIEDIDSQIQAIDAALTGTR